MSISNLTEDNNFDLICRSITVKNSDAELSGIYSAPFLRFPLQQSFYDVTTQNPVCTVHKTGDLVIVNGEVAIDMKVNSLFANAILVLPVITGYNTYDSLKVISGFGVSVRPVALLVQSITDTSAEVSLSFQASDGVGFINGTSYRLNYTISYRLTNI
tara:strand:- start:1702 stop:2175 length:474 start_codon:yes stop_codon:yes gene_type:complete